MFASLMLLLILLQSLRDQPKRHTIELCDIVERHSESVDNVALDQHQPIIASVMVSGHSTEICFDLFYQLCVGGVCRFQLF